MKHFGDLPQVPVGTTFPDRRALAAAGVHAPLQAGISGSPAEGAGSVVVSGGYEDDEDYGDLIIYTGQGGNDPTNKRQVADQQLVRGNAGLVKNCLDGLPVRVIADATRTASTRPRPASGTTACTSWRTTGRSAASPAT